MIIIKHTHSYFIKGPLPLKIFLKKFRVEVSYVVQQIFHLDEDVGDERDFDWRTLRFVGDS